MQSTENGYLMAAYSRQNVAFVRGSGARLWDENGNEYLDAISGVAVTNLGHSHPDVTKALTDQANLLMHTSNLFKVNWQEALAHKLARLSGMESAFFCNSGAEANETALKLAWLHAKSRGRGAPQILVMDKSFHGRTFATLAATGNPSLHQGFTPLLEGFLHVPFGDLDAIRAFAKANPAISAVLVESVQGEGGVNPAPDGFLTGLRKLCDEYGWLLMIDEIQTGIGRTGTWFGYQQFGVLPDVVTLAKGLGNGFPVGACLARGLASKLLSPGTHGSTFGGNPLACRVGCTVIDVIERDGLIENAAYLGSRLLRQLEENLSEISCVTAIRGRGLMVGVELDRPCAGFVGKALVEEKLLITVAREKTIRLLPPMICTADEIDEIAERLTRLIR